MAAAYVKGCEFLYIVRLLFFTLIIKSLSSSSTSLMIIVLLFSDNSIKSNNSFTLFSTLSWKLGILISDISPMRFLEVCILSINLLLFSLNNSFFSLEYDIISSELSLFSKILISSY